MREMLSQFTVKLTQYLPNAFFLLLKRVVHPLVPVVIMCTDQVPELHGQYGTFGFVGTLEMGFHCTGTINTVGLLVGPHLYQGR